MSDQDAVNREYRDTNSYRLLPSLPRLASFVAVGRAVLQSKQLGVEGFAAGVIVTMQLVALVWLATTVHISPLKRLDPTLRQLIIAILFTSVPYWVGLGAAQSRRISVGLESHWLGWALNSRQRRLDRTLGLIAAALVLLSTQLAAVTVLWLTGALDHLELLLFSVITSGCFAVGVSKIGNRIERCRNSARSAFEVRFPFAAVQLPDSLLAIPLLSSVAVISVAVSLIAVDRHQVAMLIVGGTACTLLAAILVTSGGLNGAVLKRFLDWVQTPFQTVCRNLLSFHVSLGMLVGLPLAAASWILGEPLFAALTLLAVPGILAYVGLLRLVASLRDQPERTFFLTIHFVVAGLLVSTGVGIIAGVPVHVIWLLRNGSRLWSS